MDEKIKISICICQVGENVRWNGCDKHARYITETPGNCLELLPACPETACGLRVPRTHLPDNGPGERV